MARSRCPKVGTKVKITKHGYPKLVGKHGVVVPGCRGGRARVKVGVAHTARIWPVWIENLIEPGNSPLAQQALAAASAAKCSSAFVLLKQSEATEASAVTKRARIVYGAKCAMSPGNAAK